MTQPSKILLQANAVSIAYGEQLAVKAVTLPVYQHRITSIIGPSGCGKSTLLRSFNRMNDFIDHVSLTGEISFNDQNIYAPDADPVAVRLNIGMVFQNPIPSRKPFMRMLPGHLRLMV